MVSTTQIRPATPLQPYVNSYALRCFTTGSFSMPKPLHAVQEFYMTFFLKDRFSTWVDRDGKDRGKLSNVLCTIFTESQGCCYWEGDFRIFCVQFTSNGISSIFGIDQKALINTIFPLEDILGDDSRLLTEQMEECKDIYAISAIMNAYLIKKLLMQKHKSYTSIISAMTYQILQSKGNISLDKLVSCSNMSLRNFERRFSDEVGISPKLYARVTRFFNAMENKTLFPAKSWTDITYEAGYYDQAHFIKECREFSCKTPEELFSQTPPPRESFLSRVEF